ncbi:MAG: mechanosensitive ion channel family protein [Bryobacteraceae bacterium]
MSSDLAGGLALAGVLALLVGRLAPGYRVQVRLIWWWLALAVACALTGWIAAIPRPDLAPRLNIIAGMFTLLGLVHGGTLLLFHVILRRLALPRLPSDLLTGIGYGAVVFFTLRRLGADPSSLLTTSAVLTAVIGLSLQDVLVNLVGGLILEFERGFAAGDWIRTDQVMGLVRDVRLRHTVLENPDGDLLIIPNSVLMRSPVTVLGRALAGEQIRHRIVVRFAVAYRHDPPAIVEAVEAALAASPLDGVAPEPRARCVVVDYQPGFVQYGVLTWMLRPGMEFVDSSAVRMRVFFAVARLGIPLAAIPYVVESRTPLEATTSQVAAERLSALNAVELFRILKPDELQDLAARLRKVSFAPGETVLREGDEGDSLFMVTHGHVRVLLSRGPALSEHIATLGPGQFFGEMSLLTGEPRSATVAAVEQVDCLVLGKQDLLNLFEQRPAVAVEMSTLITERQLGLTAAREKLSEQEARQRLKDRGADLLARIQRYFGLTAQ